MQWPWKKRLRSASPVGTMSLHTLYTRYRRQRQMWTYVVLSSVLLMLLFLMLSLFSTLTPWALVMPAAGMGFAISQSHRCRDILHTLRQAFLLQQQIEKAQAEKQQAEEAAAPSTGEPKRPERGPGRDDRQQEGNHRTGRE